MASSGSAPAPSPAPQKPSMDSVFSPDDAPAGVAPLAFIIGLLPKFLQNLLKLSLKMLQEVLNIFHEAFSLHKVQEKGKGKGEKSMHPGKEGYSSHAYFDVHTFANEDYQKLLENTKRLDTAEKKLILGPPSPNETMSQRIEKIEKKLGIGGQPKTGGH